ncbi:hypothetical protein H7Y63_02390 [Polaromonas sp.]|nr:hypothetical protein [Candidatus Saccharibacteria bacterium]
MIRQLDAWHKTKIGLLVFAVLELAICYGFASLAIDSGNLWWYLLTLVFLVGFLQNAFKFLKLAFSKRPVRAKHR